MLALLEALTAATLTVMPLPPESLCKDWPQRARYCFVMLVGLRWGDEARRWAVR